MTPDNIKTIEAILSKGDRAEVIPTKDGVKVVRIRREPVNPAATVNAPKMRTVYR